MSMLSLLSPSGAVIANYCFSHHTLDRHINSNKAQRKIEYFLVHGVQGGFPVHKYVWFQTFPIYIRHLNSFLSFFVLAETVLVS